MEMIMRYSRYFSFIFVLTLFAGCFDSSKSPIDAKHFNVSSVTFDKQTSPVIIIGGGVAGLTAANYLVQANIPCIVLEGDKPGGALAQSDSVRNWPGVLNAPGRDIVANLRAQASNNGAKIIKEKAVRVDFSQWPYRIESKNLVTGQTQTLKALSSIIALGAEPNYLNVPGERGKNSYWGKGVSNCAVCDGSLYRNKNIVVVGGGDSAVEEASYLSSLAKQVAILVRKDYFRAKDKRKKEEVLARPNVSVVFNTEVKEILGNGKHVTGARVYNNKTKQKQEILFDGLFLALGAKPNSKLFAGQLELDSHGYIVLHDGQETSKPGIYAAGDICDPVYKQAVTSASDGCKAALQAQKFLDEIGCDVQLSREQKKAEQKLLSEQEKKREKKDSALVASRTQKQDEYAQTILQSHLADQVITVTSYAQFEKIVQESKKRNKPVVVDLYANMCISCKNMEPIFHALDKKFSQKVTFLKINMSNPEINPEKITSFIKGDDIQSVPAFLFIKDGKEIDRIVSEVPMEKLERQIQTIL